MACLLHGCRVLPREQGRKPKGKKGEGGGKQNYNQNCFFLSLGSICTCKQNSFLCFEKEVPVLLVLVLNYTAGVDALYLMYTNSPQALRLQVYLRALREPCLPTASSTSTFGISLNIPLCVLCTEVYKADAGTKTAQSRSEKFHLHHSGVIAEKKKDFG